GARVARPRYLILLPGQYQGNTERITTGGPRHKSERLQVDLPTASRLIQPADLFLMERPVIQSDFPNLTRKRSQLSQTDQQGNVVGDVDWFIHELGRGYQSSIDEQPELFLAPHRDQVFPAGPEVVIVGQAGTGLKSVDFAADFLGPRYFQLG